MLEKAREAGQHCLSGALFDPRSMKELLPGFENEAPLDAEVHKEGVYFLTRKEHYQLPITPPPLRDHGNYVISINRFVKWLAGKVDVYKRQGIDHSEPPGTEDTKRKVLQMN